MWGQGEKIAIHRSRGETASGKPVLLTPWSQTSKIMRIYVMLFNPFILWYFFMVALTNKITIQLKMCKKLQWSWMYFDYISHFWVRDHRCWFVNNGDLFITPSPLLASNTNDFVLESFNLGDVSIFKHLEKVQSFLWLPVTGLYLTFNTVELKN